jgi:hypothetical protein
VPARTQDHGTLRRSPRGDRQTGDRQTGDRQTGDRNVAGRRRDSQPLSACSCQKLDFSGQKITLAIATPPGGGYELYGR